MTVPLHDLRWFLDRLDQDPFAAQFYSRFPRGRIWGGAENQGVSRRILSEAADARDLIHRMQETLFLSPGDA